MKWAVSVYIWEPRGEFKDVAASAITCMANGTCHVITVNDMRLILLRCSVKFASFCC
jgi:hypothetical protein